MYHTFDFETGYCMFCGLPANAVGEHEHCPQRPATMTTDMVAADARRYQALKKWLLENGIVNFHEAPLSDTEPFVMCNDFHGETFDAAVDTLTA
jgi:hypothetical protein